MNAYVVQADARSWLETLETGSVDLILTGPPHSTDAWWDEAEWVDSWFPRAIEVLKPTGALIVHVGPYAQELRAYLHWEPRQIWFYDWRTAHREGLPRGEGEPLVRACDPILYYPMSEHRLRLEGFTIYSGEWSAHCERLVLMATDQNDLVVDPFAGWGGCLLAAARCGRRAIGCDISEESLAEAERRGCVRV